MKRFASFNDANRFPAQTHKLPIAMLHSGFAGLIPRESDDIEIIDLICICHSAFMAEFSLLITPHEQRSCHALYENQKRYTEAARKSGLIPDEDRIVYLLAFGLLSSDSLDKMLKVAARVSTLSGRQEEASVTRSSFTIVEDRLKIVKDDVKWDELLKKAKSIVDAPSSMRSQVAAVDSLDGVWFNDFAPFSFFLLFRFIYFYV
ncbi:Nucleocapsid Phlebovirus/Tenuivirus [Arabidopsis suecica]|uniref:Nucleocapsid Phlebovirus/Tenuivirus n=1 Tax=Arabidopsis suecica TaxID=45249 RepID=A0A8T1Z590_ARASU|nr:Nucleocapsid Phlebovirus/Tenuivirus [Arabidopsis suecica]KAG7554225.1 Nucleocapsid Phlebovirus/Tenuivirus [Arabidopsis suecica]